jgi:hypothetical protein
MNVRQSKVKEGRESSKCILIMFFGFVPWSLFYFVVEGTRPGGIISLLQNRTLLIDE